MRESYSTARVILDKEPRVERITIQMSYREFDDEYHSDPESSVTFHGAHSDDDLDHIPQVRRFERTSEGLANMVPVNTEYGTALQQTFTITMDRTGTRISVQCEDISTIDATAVRWDATPDGQLADPRGYVILTIGDTLSAHDIAALLAAPASQAWADLDLDACAYLGHLTPVTVTSVTPSSNGRAHILAIEVSGSIFEHPTSDDDGDNGDEY